MKPRLLAACGQPLFIRRLNGYLTLLWASAGVWWTFTHPNSILWVSFMSAYAIVVSHWTLWRTTAVEVKQEEA